MTGFKLTSGVWINVDAVCSIEPIDPENLQPGDTYKSLVVLGSPGTGGYADERSPEVLIAKIRDAGGLI